MIDNHDLEYEVPLSNPASLMLFAYLVWLYSTKTKWEPVQLMPHFRNEPGLPVYLQISGYTVSIVLAFFNVRVCVI